MSHGSSTVKFAYFPEKCQAVSPATARVNIRYGAAHCENTAGRYEIDLDGGRSPRGVCARKNTAILSVTSSTKIGNRFEPSTISATGLRVELLVALKQVRLLENNGRSWPPSSSLTYST